MQQDELFAHAPATLLSEVGREARDRPGGVACCLCYFVFALVTLEFPRATTLSEQQFEVAEVTVHIIRWGFHVCTTLLLVLMLHRSLKRIKKMWHDDTG